MPARPASAGPGLMPLVAGARLPLAFIVGGLLAFGAGALWLADIGASEPTTHVHPRVVALAHLWLPGFLLSVCLGASYQLMPVVLGVPLRVSDKLLWAHAALHLGGVSSLVVGLAHMRYLWAALGGLALSTGALLFFVVTLRAFRASARRDAAAWSFPLAAAWLLVTVLAGVLMAANRSHPFLGLSIFDVLRAHAHLGLVGYFGALLQGVTFQLVPMFTMGEARRPLHAKAGLFAAQGGLVLLAAGLALGLHPLAFGASLVVLAGLASTAFAFLATLATRRRRKLEPGLLAFVIGMAFLGLAAALGAGLVGFDIGPEKLFPAATAYGLLIIVGGLSLVVLGMLAKILPFLVWMKAYGPRVGREAVPVATTLSSKPLEHAWLAAHLAGVLGLALGAATSTAWPALAGGVLLLLAALLALGNAARVLNHLRLAHQAGRRPFVAANPITSPPLSHP
jgi:hypothetical protein